LKIPTGLVGNTPSSLGALPTRHPQEGDNFATTVPVTAVPTRPFTASDIGTAEDFLAAVDKTIKYFNDGDIVEGTVVKVDRDEVLLDIGYKTEGVIPSRELSMKYDVDPAEVVGVGDVVNAVVLEKEDKDGRLILSRKRVRFSNDSDSPSSHRPTPSDDNLHFDNWRDANEVPAEAAVHMRLIDSWAKVEAAVSESATDKLRWLEVHTNVHIRKLGFAKAVRNRVAHNQRTSANEIEQT
jgi:predicted RNA-binding protein with RPS1 domain